MARLWDEDVLRTGVEPLRKGISSNNKEARYRLKKRSRKACAPRDPNFDLSTFKVVGQRANRKSYVIRGPVFLRSAA